MNNWNQSNAEFLNEISETLAQHESNFEQLGTALQVVFIEMRALYASRSDTEPLQPLREPLQPLIVSNSVEGVKKISNAIKVFKQIKAFSDVEKAKNSHLIRPSKDQMRNPRYIN